MGKLKHPERTSLMANLRINVDEVYEVAHWAKQLGVSNLQLRAAVEQMGPLVDGVRQYLKDQVDPQKA